MPEKFKSRKFIVVVLLQLVSGFLAWQKVITADQWLDLTTWTIVPYIGVQGAADFMGVLKGTKT